MQDVNPNAVYAKSENVVTREIKGKLIIVPMTAGIGDMEDELYTLNETGRWVWDQLDGERALGTLVAELDQTYDAGPERIEKEVADLLQELMARGMVVEVGRRRSDV